MFTPWTLLVDVGILSILLLVGKILRAKVRWIQRLFIPPSLLAGFTGLILGPEVLGWLPLSGHLGTYAGIRSKQTPPQSGGYADFTICEEEELPGWIDLIGIESPGMTASMPIARHVAGILERRIPLLPDPDFDPRHRNILRFAQQSPEVQAKLIEEDPEYGEIVCRCNQVTKKEIRQAIENPLGVRSVSAVKYRAWATTGRCNGGYCLARIVDMLEKEYGIPPEEITFRGPGSEMFTGHVKNS